MFFCLSQQHKVGLGLLQQPLPCNSSCCSTSKVNLYSADGCCILIPFLADSAGVLDNLVQRGVLVAQADAVDAAAGNDYSCNLANTFLALALHSAAEGQSSSAGVLDNLVQRQGRETEADATETAAALWLQLLPPLVQACTQLPYPSALLHDLFQVTHQALVLVDCGSTCTPQIHLFNP